MTPTDLIDFLKGNHGHPLFYWVWPKMKILLDMELDNLKERLREVLLGKKNMPAEDHLTMLIKGVKYSAEDWHLLINCAMAGKPTVKKIIEDEQTLQFRTALRSLDEKYLLMHTFPDAIKILFTFNLYSQLRSDYAATRVLYPMRRE